MEMEPKKMTIWAALIAFATGGGTYGGNVLVDQVLDELDERYVTVASQNLEKKWELEDIIRKIDRKVKEGTATEDDLIDRAVAEERLRQLSK